MDMSFNVVLLFGEKADSDLEKFKNSCAGTGSFDLASLVHLFHQQSLKFQLYSKGLTFSQRLMFWADILVPSGSAKGRGHQ